MSIKDAYTYLITMHFINKEDLERLYIIENKTTKQIGEIYNADRTTISNKLKKLGIEINKKQRQYQELNNKQLLLEKHYVKIILVYQNLPI